MTRNFATMALSRVVAISVLILMAGIPMALAIHYGKGVYDGYSQRIVDMEWNLEQQQRIVATKPTLERHFNSLTRLNGDNADIIDAENSALAGALLQEQIKKMVKQAGGELSSTELLSSSREKEYERVGARAHIESDIIGLQRIVHSLEAHSPVLFVHELNIEAARSGKKNDPETPYKPVTIKVGIEFYGYRQRKEGEQ